MSLSNPYLKFILSLEKERSRSSEKQEDTMLNESLGKDQAIKEFLEWYESLGGSENAINKKELEDLFKINIQLERLPPPPLPKFEECASVIIPKKAERKRKPASSKMRKQASRATVDDIEAVLNTNDLWQGIEHLKSAQEFTQWIARHPEHMHTKNN